MMNGKPLVIATSEAKFEQIIMSKASAFEEEVLFFFLFFCNFFFHKDPCGPVYNSYCN